MIQSFSDFITSNHTLESVKANKFVLDAELLRWVDSLTQQLHQLRGIFPARFIQTLISSRDTSGLKPVVRNDKLHTEIASITAQDTTVTEKIRQIDQYYQRLLSVLNTVYIRQFYQEPFARAKGSYLFSPNHSGVGFVFRIIGADSQIIANSEIETQSVVGEKDKATRTEIITSVKMQVGKNETLNNALAKVNAPRHFEIADLKSPHAEDIFFTHHLNDAIVKIREAYNGSGIIPTDELWLTHFTQPRIEFVQTSSICGKCQPYFKALRQILTDNNIFIPMVMFAGSGYNLGEPSHPIAYIDMQGEYQCPMISWQEDNGKERYQVKDIQALQDYAYFELRGRAILPLLLKSELLAMCFWKKLASCLGGPVYFLWLADFTVKLFSASNPDMGKIPITQEDFPIVDVGLPKLIKSEAFESYYREAIEEVITEDKAYFDFLWGINFINNNAPLSEAEFAYWQLFLKVVRHGEIRAEPKDGTPYTLTEADFVDFDTFLKRSINGEEDLVDLSDLTIDEDSEKAIGTHLTN